MSSNLFGVKKKFDSLGLANGSSFELSSLSFILFNGGSGDNPSQIIILIFDERQICARKAIEMTDRRWKLQRVKRWPFGQSREQDDGIDSQDNQVKNSHKKTITSFTDQQNLMTN